MGAIKRIAKMRIAHCVTVSPNRCGLYGTARDLVSSEIKFGLDAGFIDAGIVDPNTPIVNGVITGYPKIVDKEMAVRTTEWGRDADCYVRHSFIPVEWQNKGKPLIMAMHGRPESSFRLEQQGILAAMSTFYKRGLDKRYLAFWCFWPEYIDIWKTIIPEEKLFYIPAPVDLIYYNHNKPKRDLGTHSGSPNILIADIWREDITPFNMIFAAHKFQQKYCKTAKIHIVALQGKNLKAMSGILNGIKKDGALGSISYMTKDIIGWYRAADIFITPHVIATRTVREPLACGVPIVAGLGNKYTPYKANPMDTEAFAKAINECWLDLQSDGDKVRYVARQTAEIAFNFKNTGRAILNSLRRIGL